MKEKPRTVKKPVHGNPMKPGQITSWIEVAIEDGESDDGIVIQDGQPVKLTKTPPSTLHKPQDVGIPDWQKRDLDPD